MSHQDQKYLEMERKILSLVTQDPGLPKPSPSVSFWQEPSHPISNIQSPELPPEVDIAIVGSGITGCSVAHTLLAHPTLQSSRIVVLEARSLTSGATGRNGGHVALPAFGDFPNIAALYGDESAAEVVRFLEKNCERVAEVVQSLSSELQEATEFRRVTKITNCTDQEYWDETLKGFEHFQRVMPDLASQYKVISAEEAKRKYHLSESCGAVEQPAGALWPYRFVTGIFADLLEKYRGRFSIESNTPVAAVTYQGPSVQRPYTIQTPRGCIEAAKVVYCTNAFTAHLIPRLTGLVYPIRGTMSTQHLSPEAPRAGHERSYFTFHKPKYDPETEICKVGFYYITQNAKTGDFFIGGEKQRYDQMLTSNDSVVSDMPAKNLAETMAGLFCQPEGGHYKTTVKRVWSGIMGYTADWMPLVGRLTAEYTGRWGDGEWIAGGFNGFGMDKCWISGETLGGMIAGDSVNPPRIYQVSKERLERMSPDALAKRLAGFLGGE